MIPMKVDNWEFYHISGQGYHLRFKNQEHPTAFVAESGYTYFEDMDSGRVSKVEPHATVTYPYQSSKCPKQIFTENLHERLESFFSLNQQISWNYHHFRDAPILKLREEVKMLWYIDLIRDYFYTHAIKYGSTIGAMRFTCTNLAFLSMGGMCKCGHARAYHRDKYCEYEGFTPDFTYGVSEDTARILMSEIKTKPGGYNIET